MKNLILTLLLTPILAVTTVTNLTDSTALAFKAKAAVKFQNQVRDLYDIHPLKLDKDLTRLAKLHAKKIVNYPEYGLDTLFEGGQIITTFSRENKKKKNYYLAAAVDAAVHIWDEERISYYHTTCEECYFVGFGMAKNKKDVVVVTFYDKQYGTIK